MKTTASQRVLQRAAKRCEEVKAEIEKRRKYMASENISPDALVREAQKLVALTDEQRTLFAIGLEAPELSAPQLAGYIANAMAMLFARTAGRPEAENLKELAFELAGMVIKLSEGDGLQD